MKKLILAPLALISVWCFCQDLPNIIPQSPQAASLSKYSEFPVGTFTGIPAISVPLYTVECGDITLPLTLNYHAGGFRVNEEASWVGLGWNLNMDAAITRTINGVDDFLGGSKKAYHSSNPRMIDILLGNGFNGHASLGAFNVQRPYESVIVDGQNRDYKGFIEAFDWEPDIYSINCFDYNGKFVFDQDTNLFFLEKQDMIIKKTPSGWVAKTNNGFQYFFENESKTYNSYQIMVSSSWFLTRIVSPKNRQASFFYTTGDWQNELSYSESDEKPEGDLTQEYDVKKVIMGLYHEEVYLDSILLDDGSKILFKRGPREDIYNGEKLNGIEIYNMEKTLIREFEFHNNYSEAENLANGYYTGSPHYSYSLKRLQLDTLVEKGGTDIKKYVFKYSSVKLPNKDSYAQDYWGYYNGSQNNSLLPGFEGTLLYEELRKDVLEYYHGAYIVTYVPNASKMEYRLFNGANRKPNKDFMGACILKKIIYPTGGYTEFEFEANEYRNISEENAYDYVLFSQHVKRTSFANAPDVYYESCQMPFDYPAGTLDVVHEKFEVFVEHFGSGTPNYDYDSIIVDANTTDNAYPHFNKTMPIETIATQNQFFSYTENIELPHTANLNRHLTGPIMLRIAMPETNDTKSITLTYTAKLKVKSSKIRDYAGGLRIKSINHCEGTDPTKNIVKTYSYEYDLKNPDNTIVTTSSGIIKLPVKCHSFKYGVPALNGESKWSSVVFSSSTNFALTPNQSNHIGYSKITEYLGKNGELGRTEYDYKNEPNIIFEHYLRPVGVPSTVQTIYDGKLLSKTLYNSSGQKVSSTTNEYELLNESIVRGIYQDGWVYRYAEGVINLDKMHVCGVGDGCMHYYPIISRWEALKKTTEEFIYGDNTITSVTEYNYNADNLLPSSIITTNSNGDILKNRKFYPQDITGVNFFSGRPLSEPEYNAVNNMKKVKDDGKVGLYMTSTVVQECEYNNDVLTETHRTNFKFFNGMVLPHKILTATYNNPLDTIIKFYDYDSKGNLLQVSKLNDVNVCYLWGYKGTYPVAKIENATISQIRTLLNGLPNLQGPLLPSQISLLKTGLPNSLISTYEFIPMIGMTSQTDPNGVKTFFEYNGLGQLKAIRNDDGNVLKSFDYHYKQQ